MRKIYILFVILFLIIFNNVYAGSIKEEYELAERCKNSADKWFQKEYGGQHISNDGKMTTMADYQCHYNKKLNKCFILITTTSISNDKKGHNITISILFDINENKEYGEYHTVQKTTDSGGSILDINSHSKVFCDTKGAWDSLVKPYMEE